MLIAILAIAEENWDWTSRLVRAPAWAYAAAIGLFLFCLELLGFADQPVPFIYFQF